MVKITEVAQIWIDGTMEEARDQFESENWPQDWYNNQAEFFRKNESHIGDCFTDTGYCADENGVDQYELQSEIVRLVNEIAND